jgi:hypothetical protein
MDEPYSKREFFSQHGPVEKILRKIQALFKLIFDVYSNLTVLNKMGLLAAKTLMYRINNVSGVCKHEVNVNFMVSSVDSNHATRVSIRNQLQAIRNEILVRDILYICL